MVKVFACMVLLLAGCGSSSTEPSAAIKELTVQVASLQARLADIESATEPSAEATSDPPEPQFIGGRLQAETIVTDRLIVGSGTRKILISSHEDSIGLMFVDTTAGAESSPLEISSDPAGTRIKFLHGGMTNDDVRATWFLNHESASMVFLMGSLDAPQMGVIADKGGPARIFASGTPGETLELTSPASGQVFFRQ